MRFKNYFYFSATFLFIASFSGQSQTMVQNWLTESNNAAITNSDDKPYITHVDGTGQIAIAGVSNSKVVVATYDGNGNDLWTNKYGTYASDYPIGVAKGNSGNYLVGYFFQAGLRKIGVAGGTSWSRTSSKSYFGASFAMDSNGDAYMVGQDYPGDTMYIEKINSVGGGTIWIKKYPGYFGKGCSPVKILLDHANNLLIAANSKDANGDNFVSIIKFDTIGANQNKIYDNCYTTTKGQAYDLMLDNSTNACYVTGSVNVGGFNHNDMLIYKSGPAGTINWSDVYNESNSDDRGCSLQQDAAGNVFVALDSHNPLTKYGIRKYNSSGSLLASNGITYTIWGSFNYSPILLIHPGNHQVYLAGTRNSMATDNFMALYKTDLDLTSINQIYSFNYDVTEYDYATDLDIDPVSQDLILSGNIYKTVTGNDYFYARVDTVGNFIYNNIYNGIINGSDYVTSIVTDANNNAVVAGGTYSTLTKMDGFMVKYDAAGNEQWQSVLTGAGGFDDYLRAVAVNTSGHYYAGGYSKTGGTDRDMWILKVDGNGTKVWDITQTGTQSGGEDEVLDLQADNLNNGYVVGYQTNTGTGRDASIIKFNSSGTILWNKKYTSAGSMADGYKDISFINGNPLYVAGYTTKANGESDMLIAKYTTAGNLSWATTLNSPQSGNDTALAIAQDGNYIYVVGSSDSAKAITAKYDLSGNLQWSATEPTVSEVGPDIIAMPAGYVFIACYFDSASYHANRIICYDGNGNHRWHRDYYNGCCEHPMKMYKTSRSTAIIALDYYGEIGAIELDTNGNELNNVLTNLGSINYLGGTRGLTADATGDLYVTGYFPLETGFDIFTQKLCYTPAPVSISGSDAVCAFSKNNLYGVPTNTTITGYNWGSAPGFTINPGAQPNVIAVDVANSAGYVFVQQSNYCGASPADSVYVNVLPLPAVSAGPDQQICPGSAVALAGSGAQTYAWSSGITDGVPFTPSMTQWYEVTGTDTSGCSSKDTVVIALKQPPLVGLCLVTVDTFSTHNILYWEKAGLTNEVAYFNIYREDITNNYTLIGSVSYDSLSEYQDYDTTMADPNLTTKRYKIAAVDTCGNEGPKSMFHNTIFISNNNGTFSWNTYVIQNSPNPVNNYILYRDNLSNGNWVQVGTTAGTQNILNDGQYATYQNTGSWRVETVWNITCTPTMRQANGMMTTVIKSKSNISNNRQIGIKSSTSINYNVYPNPTSGELNIQLNAGEKAQVRILSLVGAEVYSGNIEGNGIIDMSKHETGIYLVQVTSQAGTSITRIIKN